MAKKDSKPPGTPDAGVIDPSILPSGHILTAGQLVHELQVKQGFSATHTLVTLNQTYHLMEPKMTETFTKNAPCFPFMPDYRGELESARSFVAHLQAFYLSTNAGKSTMHSVAVGICLSLGRSGRHAAVIAITREQLLSDLEVHYILPLINDFGTYTVESRNKTTHIIL